MSTAKKQKEAHEFKLLADKEALYLSMREKRRAQRNITNIGNTAEQDVDSTDNEDKEVIEDIKTINNEIYQLKIKIGTNFLQAKVGKEQKGDMKDRMIQGSLAAKKEKMLQLQEAIDESEK